MKLSIRSTVKYVTSFSYFVFYLQASLYSKMEKADILDLTVNYLKSVKCDQGFLRDATSLAKYRLGYNDCAGEMTQYIMSDAGLDYHNRAKLLSQMASSCQKANLRTTAEMNLPGSRAPLYARPPAIPIALSANRLPPSMSSPIPIYPSSFNPTEINRPVNVSMGSSSVILKESNVKSNCYSPLFMTSSTALSGLESSGSNVWRPW